jgi:hypothetical protein
MRVAVLGHRGMLGSVVAQYMAEQGHEVHTFTSEYRFPDERLMDSLRFLDPTIVINCIKGGIVENTALPHLLATEFRLIQPSTDAVGEDSDYARQKAAGEAGAVIRCGLVDVHRQPRTAYPEWVCNPLTPLEWARVAERIDTLDPPAPEHGGYPIDRYSLAVMVADIFGGEPPILGHGEPKSRVLKVTHHRYIRDALLEYRAWLQS